MKVLHSVGNAYYNDWIANLSQLIYVTVISRCGVAVPINSRSKRKNSHFLFLACKGNTPDSCRIASRTSLPPSLPVTWCDDYHYTGLAATAQKLDTHGMRDKVHTDMALPQLAFHNTIFLEVR
ncbi:hypothetical protein F443_04178 [Phytophthora nicotianae P1569]|uniref:Uncharacterized protein n=1 Tax=Phytophthora nicotianae P1569 TaxID=1317065 RepID=V9FPQ3_PHYNI|nr:hypothetical protein F443_04178 [Phytophthora nicotianae P1569]